jgi:hypothetical protein
MQVKSAGPDPVTLSQSRAKALGWILPCGGSKDPVYPTLLTFHYFLLRTSSFLIIRRFSLVW